MPNLNPNSTNYRHSFEPNTNDLTMAMDYTEDGKPAIRVLSNIQGDITIEGGVTIPGRVKVENSTGTTLAINDNNGSITVDGTVNIGTMPSITITDNFSEYTSKKRLKVSTYETQFFNTFQFGKETDVWDEAVTTGGTAYHDATVSGVIMQVNSTVGAEVIRQTRNVMKYIPGRSSELSFAVRLETPVLGVRRRFGLFDEKNGFYFEDGGVGNYYCWVRNFNGASGPTLTRIPREQWNGDRLDGQGISGITANPLAQQLVVFDYEWYGAGTVVIKFVIDGIARTIHTFYHANRINTVWCATPFLPIRLELTNVTGAVGTHRMFQGSNSLISEGVEGKLGIAENITTDITGKSLGSPNIFRPMLSIRLKSTALSGIVLPAYFQAVSLSNANIFYKIIYNAVLTGAAWTDMPDENSFTQYDQSATACTGGRDIDSGFVSVNAQGLKIELDQNTRYQLGRGSLGTVSDTLTLAMASPTNNATAAGTMTWIEQR